jgi:hypothetical protein
MSFTPEELTDQNWHPDDKLSLFGYLRYLCFKALYAALVGRSGASAETLSIPVRSETSSASPPRISRR